MHEKIVVTGMGAISAVGNTIKENWENISEGVSGVGPITAFDPKDFSVKVACQVKDFNADGQLSARDVRRRDRYQQFAAVATQEALNHSELEITEENAGRIGVVLSSSIGGLISIEQNILKISKEGPRKASPFLIPRLMSNGAAGLVGIDHGPKGPAFSISSACASGQDSIGIAWMMLRSGVLDVIITGASDAVVTSVAVAGFDRVGALSRRSVGEKTPRPFDKDRDGLVIGEGCGVLILERESFARERGAQILAELAGYAATADAYHITAPAENGEGGSRAMQLAMEAAKVNHGDIGYINAHGTATQMNDKAETDALKSVFGEMAYEIPISSTKSMTGHMMGATGALELIYCILALKNSILPPTINYHTPDPDCDLDYIPNEARDKKITVAMSNAFGFGGHNSVLIVRSY